MANGRIPLSALTVDELQLSPALCLSPNQALTTALEEAYMRDYTILPVTSKEKKLLGYLNVPSASDALQKNKVHLSAQVKDVMQRFERQKQYTLLTPDTGLDELKQFLQDEPFGIVTDAGRKFVLAVVTREDLEKFTAKWTTPTSQ